MKVVAKPDPVVAPPSPVAPPEAGLRQEPEARFERRRCAVLGVPIDVISCDDALARVTAWGARRESRVVSICNVHSVVTASRDPAFLEGLEASDIVTPDGMPVVWMLRALGNASQERVDGPDLMWAFCTQANERGDRIFLYGSTPQTLDALEARLHDTFPTLRIAGRWSPPFRELTPDEDEAVVRRINDSGAQVVFVGLGCPRQETWMRAHRGRIRAVMVGVGAAFDFHAGTIRRAPRWMRASGLEWVHRLAAEPRRLWKRYLVTNTAFVAGALRQLWSQRRR
jgi:N-acetylglucosaminyldiphosphoundecaprenol N-acetyl-beta-D-mannosaminyltransferase